MSPWLFRVHMDAVIDIKWGCSDRYKRRGVRFQEEGREWRLPGFLYADDLVLCGESEKDLRAMVGCFAKVCR